ncbi:MAG: Gfo/Idh/MocA family oxidoreductase [Fuerstiella sp.]|nr:Gfo/Idh/MocA family oxidoreductase [Fuerstiella sp.]
MNDAKPSTTSAHDPSRRQFMGTSLSMAAVGVGAGSAASPAAMYAGGDDVLRVGLIGCGGRGTGAAQQALRADQNVKLVAMADAFEDRLQMSLRSLSTEEDVADKIHVPPEKQFVGFDAYQKLLASDVDVVLLTTPPHFRPMQLKAAIAAGKHVFAEKPVAVDAPGVHSVLETCAEAKRKNLSVVSGLCIRYDGGFRETVKRLHDGAIGDIHTLIANDYRGSIWVKPRKDDWTDMHWQMRNWYYFTWLSGDFNVEQHVHYLDVCAWVMGEYPVKAMGLGGRQVRTDAMYGNIYDHHSVAYEFENGARFFSNCRQQSGCKNNMSAYALGSKGRAEVSERRLEITTDTSWRFDQKVKNMYQVEHDEMFAGIRAGKPLNNGQYMAHSTMLAIMGRMATYTGQEITWEKAMASQQNLSPDTYAWGDAPEVEIARPGITKFI